MTCRDALPLLSAERDRTLSAAERAALEQHVVGCADCARLRAQLAAAATSWSRHTAAMPAPEGKHVWQTVRARLRAPEAATPPTLSWPRVAAWAGAPLAAAAALALLVWSGRAPAAAAPPRADFVEAGDAGAATMVYVDQESGWLIVWASAPAPAGSS